MPKEVTATLLRVDCSTFVGRRDRSEVTCTSCRQTVKVDGFYIQGAVGSVSFSEELRNVRRLGDVSAQCDGIAATRANRLDCSFHTIPTRCIVHDD